MLVCVSASETSDDSGLQNVLAQHRNENRKAPKQKTNHFYLETQYIRLSKLIIFA
jgi:hypothetical protein